MKDKIEFTDITIDLRKFNLMSESDQNKKISDILNNIYDNQLKVNKRLIFKVIRLTWNINDSFTYLPHNVKVVKENMNLTFSKAEKKSVSKSMLIFSIALLVFGLIGATYTGFNYLKMANLNKDIYKDGIRILNIDLNKDYEPNINVDLNGDDIPDINIDYKGDQKARFNIDTTGDNKADSNLITRPINGKCSINCDIDGDGWPDINLDLDGDGIADINIDTDGDLIPDLNIDVSGDGICDLMCDTTGDGICDKNCVYIPIEVPILPDVDDSPNGADEGVNVSEDGSNEAVAKTPNLIINYKDGLTINAAGLLPDDQPNIPEELIQKPKKEFTIENLSTNPIAYGLSWTVSNYTFITNNLEYNVVSSNGGYSSDWKPVPSADDNIVDTIIIAPRTVQKYTINLRLKGLGAPQDEDQNKIFIGKIDVRLEPK